MAGTVKDAILRSRKTLEVVVEGGLNTVETVVEAGLNTVDTVVDKGRQTVESAVSLGRRTVEQKFLSGQGTMKDRRAISGRSLIDQGRPFDGTPMVHPEPEANRNRVLCKPGDLP